MQLTTWQIIQHLSQIPIGVIGFIGSLILASVSGIISYLSARENTEKTINSQLAMQAHNISAAFNSQLNQIQADNAIQMREFSDRIHSRLYGDRSTRYIQLIQHASSIQHICEIPHRNKPEPPAPELFASLRSLGFEIRLLGSEETADAAWALYQKAHALWKAYTEDREAWEDIEKALGEAFTRLLKSNYTDNENGRNNSKRISHEFERDKQKRQSERYDATSRALQSSLKEFSVALDVFSSAATTDLQTLPMTTIKKN